MTLDRRGALAILDTRLKKKFTVASLICLFVWNVAFSGVSGLLVCLHQDFLHLGSGACDAHHCGEADTHDCAEAVCSVDSDCTDFEIQGAPLMPTRLNEVESVVLPVVDCVTLSYQASSHSMVPHVSHRLALLRAPPWLSWLTDQYLSKTVIRV